MLGHDIYPINAGSSIDNEVHAQLAKDSDLVSHLKCVGDEQYNHLGGNIYLSALVDVYIGNPIDQMSLWVARMRYALGMNNTYIFMEEQSMDHWVSYMNDDSYLDLYDAQLGPWMG